MTTWGTPQTWRFRATWPLVLENRVVKVDLSTGQMLADVELLGAQGATLLDDGTVVVTREVWTMPGSHSTSPAFWCG